MGENDENREDPKAEPVAENAEDVFVWPAQADVVKVAEDALRRAKLGQLRSIAIIGETPDAGLYTTYTSGDRKFHGLFFGIESVKMRMLTHQG